MMYHCIAVKLCIPSDTENFEDPRNAHLHQPIHNRQKYPEEENRRDHHAGRRNNVLATWPRYLFHFHANIVQKLARVVHRAGDLLADSSRRPGDCVALRLFVLHFNRLRGHSSSSQDRRERPSLISGRGGGTRTPIPGFGDRSPNRWTTPLKTQNRSARCLLQNGKLLNFLVPGVLAARIAKLPSLDALGVLLLVLGRCVIAVFAIAALQRDDFSHGPIPFLPSPSTREGKRYSMISVTAPAPTVWPPSRIANRNPFSSATGVISVTSQLTLSPGSTISTPVGNFTSPVTSVVRK